MTHPEDGKPGDGRPGDGDRPPTRRFEPIDPVDHPAPPDPTAPLGPAGQPGATAPIEPGTGAGQGYESAAAYSQSPPGYYGQAPYQAPDETPPRRNRSRTVLLSLLVILALAVLVLAGLLVFRSLDDDGGDGPAASGPSASTSTTDSASSTTTPSTTTSSTATSSSEPSGGSRPTAAPGAVTYQFTGSGNLVGVTYATTAGEKLVAATGAPWSVRADVGPGGRAAVGGIVVGGTVTCTILHGEDLLASSTSSGGPISCAAVLDE